MKHLQNYQKYNESLFGEISRLNPKRYKNDVKMNKLFDEIYDDFVLYGKNLKKVKIIKDDNEISFSRVELGMSGKLIYNFGKYHPINNDVNTGNQRAGNRRIEISYLPLSFVFKKNSLEKSFGTSRFSNIEIRVKDKKIIDNPIYNPNIQRNLGFREQPTDRDREMMVMYKEIKDEYTVSGDIAVKIIKYFIDEYNRQYPEITGKYRNSMEISDVEKGVNPTIKYIEVKSKDDEWVTAAIRKGDNEKEITRMIKSMTKDEFKKYDKEQDEKMYEPYYTKKKKEEEILRGQCENIIKPLLDKYNFEYKRLEFRIYPHQIQMNMTIEKPENEIDARIKKMCIEIQPIPINKYEYVYDSYRISSGYNNDNISYVTIILENTEFKE